MRGQISEFRVPQLLNLLLSSDGVLELNPVLGTQVTLSCTRGALRALSVGGTAWYDAHSVQACLTHLIAAERGRFALHLETPRTVKDTNVRALPLLELPLGTLVMRAYGSVDALSRPDADSDDHQPWTLDDLGLEVGIGDATLRAFLSFAAHHLKPGLSIHGLHQALGLERAWVRAMVAHLRALRALRPGSASSSRETPPAGRALEA